MSTFDSNSFEVTVDHHLGPLVGVGILNHPSSTGSMGGKDDTPPQPVELYGARKPLGDGGHEIFNYLRTGRVGCYKIVHGTDEMLAGKPQGPKKPIGPPQPLDPYGSRKPSSAHCGVESSAFKKSGFNILMKSFMIGHTVGRTVHTIAQYLGTTPTATMSVNV